MTRELTEQEAMQFVIQGEQWGGAMLPDVDLNTDGVKIDMADYPEVYGPDFPSLFQIMPNPDYPTVTKGGVMPTEAEIMAAKGDAIENEFMAIENEPIFKDEPAPVSVFDVFNQYNIQNATIVNEAPETIQSNEPELIDPILDEPEAIKKACIFSATNKGCVVSTLIIILILILILFKK